MNEEQNDRSVGSSKSNPNGREAKEVNSLSIKELAVAITAAVALGGTLVTATTLQLVAIIAVLALILTLGDF